PIETPRAGSDLIVVAVRGRVDAELRDGGRKARAHPAAHATLDALVDAAIVLGGALGLPVVAGVGPHGTQGRGEIEVVRTQPGSPTQLRVERVLFVEHVHRAVEAVAVPEVGRRVTDLRTDVPG